MNPSLVTLRTVLVNSELSELDDRPDAADVQLRDASGVHVENKPRRPHVAERFLGRVPKVVVIRRGGENDERVNDDSFSGLHYETTSIRARTLSTSQLN